MFNDDWYTEALEGAVPYLHARWVAEYAGDRRQERRVMRDLHRFYRSIGAPYASTYADAIF
jgi:hypothetical protein